MKSFLHSLSFRVTFWVSLVVISIVSIHIALMRPGQRFLEQKKNESERVARIIETHLPGETAAEKHESFQEQLEQLSDLEGIRRVEIVDTQQKVRFSSDRARVGRTFQAESDMSCLACHESDPPLVQAVYRDEAVGRVFVAGHSLQNGPACIECHADNGETLGSILVELDLAAVDEAALTVRRRLISVGSVLLVVMVLGMAAIIHALVGRPARVLLSKMRRIESADFDIGTPQASGDELGALDQGLHNMVTQLQGLYDEMETKIRERTNSLYQTQAQVMHQEKLAGIGQLAAGVAHEIGNPLTAIDSLVQLLAVEAKDEDVSQNLRTIQHQVDRISEIVHNMADLSRPLSLDIQLVNVNSVIASVLHLVRYDARFRRIEISTSLDRAIPRVRTVEDRLFGVFLNLFLNSADAMPAGGRLTIESKQSDDAITVSITDTGHGIRPEDQARIFEPYFTTKASGAGTGLGLSVCREFLKGIGGDIEVRSAPGAGSTFVAHIPIDPRTEYETIDEL